MREGNVFTGVCLLKGGGTLATGPKSFLRGIPVSVSGPFQGVPHYRGTPGQDKGTPSLNRRASACSGRHASFNHAGGLSFVPYDIVFDFVNEFCKT